MKGLISFILGFVSFALIAISQWNAYHSSKRILLEVDGLLPAVVSVDWKVKFLSIALAIFTLAISIGYTRSGQQKMSTINRIGRFLAILAIILSIMPIYQAFLK